MAQQVRDLNFSQITTDRILRTEERLIGRILKALKNILSTIIFGSKEYKALSAVHKK
jgi:hypothetical protein